ncbi:MAG: triose-phosphate isomerase [Desulfobacteraceae bacterium]|nr:triose-phosphate isomerase [Desulfobacteraceae bacterium]
MTDRIPLIAGNWKMNLTLMEGASLVKSIRDGIQGLDGVEVLVAPPFTALATVKGIIGDAKILLAAQNMHWEQSGAYTGEMSPLMLLEAGCTHVILGHSERRMHFQETDEMIDLKANAALQARLTPVICIGETLQEREADQTFEVLKKQLDGSLKGCIDRKTLPFSTILAYEPVWAIGTGRTATPDQAQEVHRFVREWIAETFGRETAVLIRILYGGSVKPDNAKDLMSRPDIDGALVGGASLKADSFIPIIRFGEE